MSLYILDSVLRRIKVVDQFESLIWTERYSSFGDFELIIEANSKFRALLQPETRLSLRGSDRIMEVETIDDSVDQEGRKRLKIVGRSLEWILENRIAILALNMPPVIPPDSPENTAGEVPKWTITDTPGNIARKVFNHICRLGTIDPNDKIPFLVAGSLYPPDTVPEPTAIVTMELEVATVYQVVKDVCDTFDLGFRLVRGPDDSKLYFDIYTGNDRTSSQSTVPAVIFSQDLDNIQNISQLTSVAQYKNVAYVRHQGKTIVVYSNESGSDVAGFDKRAMLVNVDTLPEFEGTALEIAEQELTHLRNAGMEALAQSRIINAFDGEIPQYGSYQYGTQYKLGDMVEMRTAEGGAKNMRISEQIIIFDGEGERSYPTLTDVLYITPGSWLSWDYNQTWSQAVGEWADA